MPKNLRYFVLENSRFCEESRESFCKSFGDSHKLLESQKSTRIQAIICLNCEDLSHTFSEAILDSRDLKRLRESPNLAQNRSFCHSRVLKYYCKDFLRHFAHSSISHKGKMALLALSQHKIGADLELFLPRDFRAQMDFAFSEIERDFVGKSSDKLSAFYRIWTQKEAVLKCENLALCDIKRIECLENGVICDGLRMNLKCYTQKISPNAIFSIAIRVGDKLAQMP